MREYPRTAIATKADTDKRDSNVIESIVIGENKVGVVRVLGIVQDRPLATNWGGEGNDSKSVRVR